MVAGRITDNVECSGQYRLPAIIAIVADVVIHPALLASDTIGIKLRNSGPKTGANGIKQGNAIYRVSGVFIRVVDVPGYVHGRHVSRAKPVRPDRPPVIRGDAG